MSNLMNFPNETLAIEQAGAWIARLDRGLSATERLELRRWLDASPRHRDALFEVADLWDRMSVLDEISELFPLEQRPAQLWAAYARPVLASMLLAVAILTGGFLLTRDTSPDLAHWVATIMMPKQLVATYRTAMGAQRAIQLPDHSVVTLNTDSEVRVQYTSADRRLELVRGEAHFKVAKDSNRVFTVRVGENEFKAVGTAFNIRMDSPRGVELTVTEGRVRVIVPSAKDPVRIVEANSEKPVATEIMVDAGKEVAIDQVTQTVERLQPAKLEAVVAWKQGMIVFDAEPLEQAVHDLARYSKVKFVIADEEIRRTPVTGYFKIGDIDGLVAALHANFDIDASKQDGLIVLSAHALNSAQPTR